MARSEITALHEKRSKVLSVFSPNDMDILSGILDSGSGAELQQARQTLLNVQKLTPDGGYIYPVKFNPTNWFELLDTSFTPADLLKSPAALATQMIALSSRRITINARINEMQALIPSDEKIKEQDEQVKKALEALDTAQKALISSYGDGICTVFSAALDIADLFKGGKVPKDILKKLVSGSVPSDKITDDLKKLTDAITGGYKTQLDLIKASQELSTAMMHKIDANNMDELKSLLLPLKEQLEQVDAQIANLQMDIRLSTVMTPKCDEEGKTKTSDLQLNNLASTEVPPGYTQILIEKKFSTMNKASAKSASASTSSSGCNFWFGGYSSKTSNSSSSFSSMTSSSDTDIQIGMNVAKVGIEREWFNPGLFVLTKDMFNVSTAKVAPKDDYTSMSDDRLNAMNKSCILPSYPTAMLIARDISIKVVSQNSLDSSFAESAESHAAHGGGFLFFSGSSSSSSSSSNSGVHTLGTSNSLTIKFSTPQIIGYYLQATPTDKSSYLDDTNDADEKAGYVTISKFVEDYREMLKKMNKKGREI